MSAFTPVRPRGARAAAVAAVTAAVAGCSLAGAPAAFALPGDSGDIDIRSIGFHSRGEREGTEVCKFVLVANNFESFESVPWSITAQPPTVPPGDTLLGTLPLVDGKARSQQYLLPEGTYQIVWTVPAGPKQKRFTVSCPEKAANGAHQGANGAAGSDAGNQESSWSEAGRETGDGAGKEAGDGYAKPSGAVPAGGGGVPDMASTSAEGGTNVAATAALIAGAAGVGGLVLVRRSARRRTHGEA